MRLGGATISHPEKLFWPDEAITKLALAQFYARIASQILPWMKSRAVTMERCPEGIRKTCFYQKQAPKQSGGRHPDGENPCGHRRPRRRLHRRRSAQDAADARQLRLYRHARDEQPRSIVSTLPDWLAFDLDPADGFEPAARTALLLRKRLEAHGLEPFVKTSGGRGLHVFVPLRRGAGQDQVRAYAAGIAAELAAAHPTLVTVEARKAKRRAPVYLDVMRNAPGQTIVPPFSVRWRPRAPVSMPLEWDEVSPRLDPAIFNIKTAERRMAAKSPWSKFFSHRQTLPRD